MEENNDLIIHAYEFDKQGGGTELSQEEISNKLKADELAWVHLDASHEDAKPWLAQNIDYLDHLIFDALLAEETRPRMVQYENGVLLILRGVNLNEGMDPEDMISIRMWIDEHRIISLQRRPLKAVEDIYQRLVNGKGPKNSGDFLTALCSRLFQRMEPVISDLDERTDTIEETILEGPSIECRHEIVDIRKMAIVLRRYIAPQKDVLSYLRTSDLPWIDTIHKRSLQESQDRVTRYVEDLDAIRERAQIVKDELANLLADKLNKNMYMLSIVAAIFLPLGFITGLLGINVGGMPGANNDIAFWIVCVICLLFIVIVTGIFKFLKWY